MIQVSGQYYFRVDTDEKKDLIDISEFLSYESVYGFDLPVAVLKVRVSGVKFYDFIPKRVGERRVFICSIGDDKVMKEVFEGVLVKYVIAPHKDNDFILSLSLIGLSPLLDRRIKVWHGNSISVINDAILDCGMKVKKFCNDSFDDSMKWIQSESTKRFVDLVWRHSYRDDDFLLLGYMGGHALVGSIKSVIKKREPWRLTTYDFESYIPVIIDPVERRLLEFSASSVSSVSIDSGEYLMEGTDFDLVFGDEKYRLYDKRGDYFHCENVHPRYWIAWERNRRFFENRFRCGVVVHDWYDFELFDPVYLSHSCMDVGGFYWIERIERVISQGGRFMMKIFLAREGR